MLPVCSQSVIPHWPTSKLSASTGCQLWKSTDSECLCLCLRMGKWEPLKVKNQVLQNNNDLNIRCNDSCKVDKIFSLINLTNLRHTSYKVDAKCEYEKFTELCNCLDKCQIQGPIIWLYISKLPSGDKTQNRYYIGSSLTL
uniref:Uncharacterized protein n=1 Tax=Strigamia maritima TaxID=126957 RepID=T1JNL1_STRMM